VKAAGLKVKKKKGDDGVWPQIISRYKHELVGGLISPDLFTGVGAVAAYPMKSGSFYEE